MRRLPLILLVVALVAAACSGGDGPTLVAADPPAETTTTTSPVAPQAAATPTSDLPPPLDVEPPEFLTVSVIGVYPHDTDAFTQGLIVEDGRMWESTGAVGPLGTVVREVDPRTGAVLDEARPVKVTDGGTEGVFGEGIELVGDLLYMLTWQEEVMFTIDAESLDVLSQTPYEGEGWGLCLLDEDTLAMSDGSAEIEFRSVDDFSVSGSVQVTLDELPVNLINELECVDGQIWANLWFSDEIVRIDPATGEVTAVVDTAGLDRSGVPDDRDAVLNGIAYDETTGTWFLTGKLWPSMFEVRFVPATAQ